MDSKQTEYQIKESRVRYGQSFERINLLLPWKTLEHTIALYHASTTTELPTHDLSSMLRIYVMQLIYQLHDSEVITALRAAAPTKLFAALDNNAPLPDEKAIRTFRQWLEQHNLDQSLARIIFQQLTRHELLAPET